MSDTMTEERQYLLHRYGLYINNDRRWLYQVRDARKGNNENGQGEYTRTIMSRVIQEVWEYDKRFYEDPDKAPILLLALTLCAGPKWDFQPIFDACYSEED